ncbi:MAG TPA: SRPBCC family protein [Polyangiaceae bacterium]|jgi:uncharacterized protein YndB with AHSA1/START domain
MKPRATEHATFVIERKYSQAPARVFAAWAEPEAKARWFVGPSQSRSEGYQLDFRVGGREHLEVTPLGGEVHLFDCVYQDIVPGERIVYCYDMHIGAARISVSLATVELKPSGTGTQLAFTEQVVFLDGYDDAGSRERGTADLLDKLALSLGTEK